MPKQVMPNFDAIGKQLMMENLGNTAMDSLKYPVRGEMKGPKLQWLADIADPAVDYVKKPLNQTGVAGALMPSFIPEMASNVAWGRPMMDPISSTYEEQEFRESPIGSTIDNVGRALETLPVGGKMAALGLTGIAGLIPMMNRAQKGRAMMPKSKIMPSMDEAGEMAPSIFGNQADDIVAEGAADMKFMPKMLQKQSGSIGGYKTPDLPMDYESRMARAKDMGFDTDQVYYHGTVGDEGISGIEKEGFKENEYRTDQSGIFLTQEPELASRFANVHEGYPVGNPASNTVVPAYLKTKSTFDARNQDHISKIEKAIDNTNWDKSEMRTIFNQIGARDKQQLIDMIKDDWFGAIEHPIINKVLKKEGFDSALVSERRISDASKKAPDPLYESRNMQIFEPEQIRSMFAKFDKKKSKSADILAGGAAATIGANTLMPELNDNQQ